MVEKESQERVYYGLEMKVVKYTVGDIQGNDESLIDSLATFHDAILTPVMKEVNPELLIFAADEDNALTQSVEQFYEMLTFETSEEEIMDVVDDIMMEYTYDDLVN